MDHSGSLLKLIELLEQCAKFSTLVFPIHPRTQAKLESTGLMERLKNIAGLKTTVPLPYSDFMHLMKNATYVLTDSGGVQEETTHLQIPCLTCRSSTERPVTIEQGSNTLISGTDSAEINQILTTVFDGTYERGENPVLWDGKSSERIVEVVRSFLD